MLRDKPTQTSQSAIGKVATNITGDSNSYDSHEYSENYARLDSVIKEFPDSEAIVQRLNKMFVNVADVRDDGKLCVGNGDAQLKLIENEIYNMIVNDASFQADEVPEEIINQFCVALIAVAVAKCRVLLRPGDDDAAA